MKHRYHFGSPNYPVPKEVAQVSALISNLDRVARILDSDIATEEERAGVSDPNIRQLSVLARMMTARRNNLKETIGALERRLSSQPVKAIDQLNLDACRSPSLLPRPAGGADECSKLGSFWQEAR